MPGIATFARFSELLNVHLQRNPNSRVRNRKIHFESFQQTFADATLAQLTPHSIGLWFQHIKRLHNLSDRTLNTIKSELNSFFRDLVDQNLLSSSPLERIKFEYRPTPRRKRVVLSVNEVKSILFRARIQSPQILYPFLFLCAHTGARRSEVLNLKREDIDLNTKLIHFQNTKNGQDRAIRMTDSIAKFLKRQLKPHCSGFVIPYQDRDEIVPRHIIQKGIRKLRVQCGILKPWGAHSFRHSYAHNFLKQGGNMYQLQAILGHKSIAVTIDVYGQLAAQDVAGVTLY